MPHTVSSELAISTATAAPEDVAIGAGSVQSGPAPQSVRMARLCATVDCRFLVGANPTALATSSLLPAGAVEYVAVNPGWRVAAIQVLVAGALSVTWCE